MRAWIVAIASLALVVACKGKGKGKEPGKAGTPEAAKAAVAAAPAVAVPTVLAKDDGPPPFLLVVDAAGTVRLGAARSWADLDANKLAMSKKASPLEPLDRFVREAYGLGREPLEAVKAWDEYSDDGIDLAALEDIERSPGMNQDDPPPPEEADKPDDGADESGGTGTAMALEEGKMGKRDSDRAEGQYKMQKNQDDPQLARQQAIEQARAAGILGSGTGGDGNGLLPYRADDRLHPNEDGSPTRVAEVAGTVKADGKLERVRAMVVMAPTAKATKLIEVVRDTDAAIAVSHGGKLRPLHLQFGLRDSGYASVWLEARVSAKGLVIEAVPDAPIEVSSLDAKQLGEALAKARTARAIEPEAPVDVLVDADTDVQRMIDVIVALDTAGVRTIGMGSTPSAEELARRGHRTPTTTLGQPNAQGDLDKALIRRVVKTSKPKLAACYETALATNPSLAGTVSTQFFIKPDGTVASATASGVDPAVAACVAGVIKTLKFPKPAGGGGVQVNYPFTMRP